MDLFNKKEENKKVAKKNSAVKKSTSEKVSTKNVAGKTGTAYKILMKPLITEKLTKEAENGKYAFEVSGNANKVEIAKVIKDVYGEKAVKVNIINMEGKRVRIGRINGKRKDWKKAIITLEKGKRINVYEGV